MTKYIPLGGKNGIGRFTLVDDGLFDYLSQWGWYCVLHRHTFYACRQQRVYDEKGSHQICIWMHREVLGLGRDISILVDHQDRDGLNNQEHNLRKCTNSQNRRNAKLQINNTSGYKGVCQDGNWYRARIVVEGKRTSLGYFPDPVDAAKAYDRAAKEHYGEFALLNFPEENHENY